MRPSCSIENSSCAAIALSQGSLQAVTCVHLGLVGSGSVGLCLGQRHSEVSHSSLELWRAFVADNVQAVRDQEHVVNEPHWMQLGPHRASISVPLTGYRIPQENAKTRQ